MDPTADVNRFIQMPFSGGGTLDVGVDYGTSVSDDYTPETSRFGGTLNWVQLDQGSDDSSHLIRPEDRSAVAMAASSRGRW